MTFELGRALLISGAVSVDSLAQALFIVVTRGMPLPRALLEVGAIGERRLSEELARSDVPVLRHVRPVAELMANLPDGICLRLAAVPVRRDPMTGTVDVAVLDASDQHAAQEIGHHLHAPVRVVRASLDAIRDALELYPGGVRALAPPMGAPAPPPPTPPPGAGRGAATLIWGNPAGVDDPSDPGNTPIPLSRRADTVRVTGGWEDDGIPADAPFNLHPPRPEHEPIFELRRSSIGAPPARFKPSSGPPPPAFPLLVPLAPRVPTAPNAPIPPFADAATFLSGLSSATNRDAIIQHVLRGVRAVARKAGVLVVRKDSLVGWSCTPELGTLEEFKAIKFSLETPSLLTTVLGGGLYLGPLLGAVAAPFLQVMKSTTEDVVFASARVSGRPALVIVADELGDTLLATQRIEELARAAGEALERILRERRS